MKNKIAFVALIVAVVIFFGVYDTYRYKGEEVHILPSNFKGEVNILFNVPYGVPEEHDSTGARIYRIDSTGKLYTRFKSLGYGRIDAKFFMSDGKVLRPLKTTVFGIPKDSAVNSFICVKLYGYGKTTLNKKRHNFIRYDVEACHSE